MPLLVFVFLVTVPFFLFGVLLLCWCCFLSPRDGDGDGDPDGDGDCDGDVDGDPRRWCGQAAASNHGTAAGGEHELMGGPHITRSTQLIVHLNASDSN